MLMHSGKKRLEWGMIEILSCIAIYTFLEVLYKTFGSFRIVAVGMVICSYLLPLLPVLAMRYLDDLLHYSPHKITRVFAYGLPILFGLVSTVSLLLSGLDNAAASMAHIAKGGEVLDSPSPAIRLFSLCTGPIVQYYTLSCIVVLMGLVIYAFKKRESRYGQFYRFLFKGEGISPFYLSSILLLMFCGVSALRLAIPTAVILANPVISVVYALMIAVIIHYIGHLGRYTYLDSITVRDMTDQNLVRERETEMSGMVKTELPDASQEIMDVLQRRVIRLIETDGWFLRKDISLDSVAEQLLTNRVYVSRVINQNMNTTFRAYINRLRIEYALEWIPKHPNDRAMDVADVCGFNNVSRFLLKFREQTGLGFDEWKQVHGIHLSDDYYTE